MRKKLLFVIDSLVAAGAEKSLVTLLNTIDYAQYEVDLQLFSYGGEFEKYLPAEVHLLPPFDVSKFLSKGIFQQLFSCDWKKIRGRLGYSFAIREHGLLHADRARLYWQHIGPCIGDSPKRYDAAIAYAQGIPTFYVAQKVDARKKLAWVNTDYHLSEFNQAFQHPIYEKIDHIVTVSHSSQQTFKQIFPDFSSKMTIIWDMLDAKFIEKLSHEKPEQDMDMSLPRLLTVARLNKPQKGYDITLEACRILRDRGVKFKWYAIGRGPYREEMEQFIAKHHLEDVFVLLGTTPNPYPYIKDCTIYVQTSRHEGFGLSIAEARILNRPVVTTEFNAVYSQMIQEKNGLVVPLDPTAVANAIERLLNDHSLYNSIVAFQRQEKKGNTEEVRNFYHLLNI